MPYKDPDAQREYVRKWVADRRASWFADKSCDECGATENLQLHHRDPVDKIAHSIWSWSWKRIEAEVAKCVVLCESCHREHHAVLRRRHGHKRYRAGCRCDICCAAKRAHNAWHRKRYVRALNCDARLVFGGNRVLIEVPGKVTRTLDRRELVAALAAEAA